MRFQRSIICAIAVFSIAVSTGCGQQSDSLQGNKVTTSNNMQTENPTAASTADKVGSKTLLYSKEFNQQKPELSNFKEGISFNLSEHVEDFFTDDLSNMINNNMEAIVNHDEKKFKENMLDADSITFNMDWFNYKYEEGVKYEFKELHEISFDEDAKRIQVVVTFDRNIKNEEMEQGTMTYSLLEDAGSGDWKIATMDGS
ncbi:hypothetical protein [Paenibacillus sp. JJ-223]|uniref:hypothetical protein n=1 Tax=Paenibacillus sp. JJ-223 TaxID=2905647 RepID=UPI001F2D462A|nr:hypothetical protein [Paenibacillus sp. JJ-223]CAH1205730.1 hypothetical protein PAECIP111890_02719 [Paenibacillus sp. JJ-223]